DHALTRRIQQQRGSPERAMAVGPVDDRYGRSELAGERIRALARAIGNPYLPRAAVHQTVDHGTCAAARAHHNGRAGIRAPFRLVLQDVACEPVDVVVGSEQGSIRAYDDAA